MPPPPSDDQVEAEFARVLAELEARWPENRIEPSLTRDRALMDLLGSPQTSAPVVHLAGTNGKTSTTRMIESLLRAAGLRTGMYTSPHLHSVCERISVDGSPISHQRFLDTYAEIAPFVDLIDASAGPLTWFQTITGLAFACFADAPVDVMVVECGLGGTWDSTNVVDPSTCAITPIGLDHQSYLGDTLAEVAGEKAGIITAPVPVVTAAQPDEAAEVIAARAAEQGAELLVAGRDFRLIGRDVAVGGQLLDIGGLAGEYHEVFLPLHGRHQGENATLAVASVEAFLGGRGLEPDLVREAFAGTSSPGRLEVLRTAPTVLGDAAHNPHGAIALAEALAESFGFGRVIGVVAVLEDKDVDAMLAALAPVLDRVVVTRNSSPRSLPADELA
ncbi:MAG: dihydrofolate synthase / folylpolyglutamate synthase, partial [Actinomycetota bacterium]|nr:dihydrofolate synthase / folylpolyglutamate synthase [Actinomycetota bacterium]